jgi:hypothetical protein
VANSFLFFQENGLKSNENSSQSITAKCTLICGWNMYKNDIILYYFYFWEINGQK